MFIASHFHQKFTGTYITNFTNIYKKDYLSLFGSAHNTYFFFRQKQKKNPSIISLITLRTSRKLPIWEYGREGAWDDRSFFFKKKSYKSVTIRDK